MAVGKERLKQGLSRHVGLDFSTVGKRTLLPENGKHMIGWALWGRMRSTARFVWQYDIS